MPGKLDAYNLGERGVNLVKSPIHKADGDLVNAQNAQIIPYHAQRAISKRRGMTPINGSSGAAGTILNLFSFRGVDPNPSDSDTPDYPPFDPPVGGGTAATHLMVQDVSGGSPYWLITNFSTSSGETQAVTKAYNASASDTSQSIWDVPSENEGGFYYVGYKDSSTRSIRFLIPNVSDTELGTASSTKFGSTTNAFVRDPSNSDRFAILPGSTTLHPHTWIKSTNTLTELSGFPTNAEPMRGLWINGKLYVGTYSTPNRVEVNGVYKYDPDLGTWTQVHEFVRTANSQPSVRSMCLWKNSVYWGLGSNVGVQFSAYDAESKVVRQDMDGTFTAVNPATSGVFTGLCPLGDKLFVVRSLEPSGAGGNYSGGTEVYYTQNAGATWTLESDLNTDVYARINNVWAARVFGGLLYLLCTSSLSEGVVVRRNSDGTYTEMLRDVAWRYALASVAM